MKDKCLTASLGAILLVGSTSIAQAQALDYGWFGGISAGSTNENIRDSALSVTGATASSLTKDESGTGLKLYAGYQYNRNLAVEVGYTDLGKFGATRNVTAPAALVGSAVADIKTNGYHIDGVGIMPLQGGFSLFGKLGAIYATTKTSLATSGGVIAGGTSAKRSDWSWKFGVGAGYDFSRSLGLRFEYERYNDIPNDGVIGKTDVNMWSLGLKARF